MEKMEKENVLEDFKMTKTSTVQHQKNGLFSQLTQSSVTNKVAEIWQRLGILKGHYL